MIQEFWLRISTNWNRTDTLVVVLNNATLAVFIGNCAWQSVEVTYLTLLVSIAVEVAWAARAWLRGVPHPGPLAKALTFGFIVGGLWPLGEGILVNTLGWWGQYLAPGPNVWETRVYCMLVGWAASTYCAYVAHRTLDVGYGTAVAAVVMGLTAFIAGAIGENLFAIAGMWEYAPSNLDLFFVPAFVPVGYAIAYASYPLFRRFHVVIATLCFCVCAFVALTGLGVATGFFPH